MALSKFEKDMGIISALDDEPNDVGGLSAADLKAKFDEGGQAVKTFINDTLEPEVEQELEKKASVEDLQGVTLGQIPDGTITAEKLAPGAVDSAALADDAVTAEKIAEGVIPDSYTKLETLTEETKKQYGYQSFLVSSLNEGDTIILPKNGIPTEFYVCKKSYEPDLNTSGRTLFVQKNCVDDRVWNSSGKAEYSNSDVDTWLNGEYKETLPPKIAEAMGETTFRYTPGESGSPVSTLSRSVFLLSLSEFGKESSGYANIEGEKLPIADSLLSVQLNGENVAQWTRTPQTVSGDSAWTISANSGIAASSVKNKSGVRPAFTLPNDFTYTVPVVPDDIFAILSSAVLNKESGLQTILGEKISQLKIETGSYVGTGTYNSNDPTIITFSKIKPIIWGVIQREEYSLPNVILWRTGNAPNINMFNSGGGGDGLVRGVTYSEKSVQFYSTGTAAGQLNAKEEEYTYFGIGFEG